MALDCDVLFAGAGPVGLLMALLLRQQGHSVQVIERHARRYPQPRAVGIFHQGVRALNGIGIVDRMFKTKALQDIREYVEDVCYYVDGDGEILAQFPFNHALSKSGTHFSYSIHQPTMEEELEKACQECGVIIRRSTEVTHFTDNGKFVEVETTTAGSNLHSQDQKETTTASFVVGCDGSKSVIRQAANISYIQFAPAMSRWLVLNVIPTAPGAAATWDDFKISKQHLDPERPRTSVPSALNRRRFEFLILPEESSELAITDEFIWKLLALFSCGPDTASIERRTVYSIEGCWAETFAKGRIALAGDAAHLAPQFLAQGLNSGMRDAKSLSWRLDYALKHPSGRWPSLLEQYSNEQLATTKIFVAAAKNIEQLLILTDQKAIMARNAMIKSQELPIPDLERVGMGMHLRDEKTTYAAGTEPGTLFIHDKAAKNGKEGFFDSLVSDGWALIGSGTFSLANNLTPATQQAFVKDIGGHVANFADDDGYKDISGRYGEWFKKSNIVAVLVRPDYYIYGTATSKDYLEALVKSALSAFIS